MTNQRRRQGSELRRFEDRRRANGREVVAVNAVMRDAGCRPAATVITKWQNEPKFNFKQSHLCFSRKPCRFRDPVSLFAHCSEGISRHRSFEPERAKGSIQAD